MRNKPRISITLHPRGKNSLGEARQRLGYSAYHWGILISPKNPASGPHTHLDVTDSMYIDPETGETKENWRFRERTDADPDLAFQILGRVFVGKATGSAVEELRRRMGELPLPRKGVLDENCVSWTRSGVNELREVGILEKDFDVVAFMEVALQFADECLTSGKGLGSILDYTARQKP
ncbi:hypothetical protein BJY04DRAFT_215690 [Aspergillus karnatakaensis]|uniref:uncharacterized protein n=1 Tax=Aspergillus karnatakaensis TaxID=1810916 RepID=UPI003CCD4223